MKSENNCKIVKKKKQDDYYSKMLAREMEGLGFSKKDAIKIAKHHHKHGGELPF